MEENIFYEDPNKENNNVIDQNPEKQITPITNENNPSSNQDELVSSLPSWDLIPPYEEIRRVVK